jgi:hypothetical protein
LEDKKSVIYAERLLLDRFVRQEVFPLAKRITLCRLLQEIIDVNLRNEIVEIIFLKITLKPSIER